MKSEFIELLKKKLTSELPGPIEHHSMLAKPLNKEYSSDTRGIP